MSQEIIKVVVTTPLDERTLQNITAVSDQIHIDQVSPWVLAERKGDLSHTEKLDLLLGEAEVIYGWIHHFPKKLLEHPPA